MTAEEIIATLGLARHPEGGWYRETWVAQNAGRPSGSCIYFLLPAGECSHWHRVDADEIWIHNAGAPVILASAGDAAGPATERILGPDLKAGARPQALVPAGHWQTARSTGDWSLVTCTVSPGFRFEGFDLAPTGFDIRRA
ncbi:MAG: cupin domain-containing protein [Rubellimicrobium sp.]|nr:cupin domain-containing protein [Rubellimicrobium sp.]